MNYFYPHYINVESSTDDSDEENIVNFRPERRPRTFRHRNDNFAMWDDYNFKVRCMQKRTARLILQQIFQEIAHSPNRDAAFDFAIYATGSLLIVVGDFMGVHKSTASKIIWRVREAIARLRPIYIKFPVNEQEVGTTRRQFYRIARFPRCLGAIDCTHIRIQSPGGENAEIYRNRKQFFSFNVQYVCDAKLRLGSSHDSTILANLRIKYLFETGQMRDNLLVGDSGYPIKKYLITPLRNPRTREEHLFNESQIRTRNPIERCFGVWKRRFPVLAFGIRLDIQKVQAIVTATAVLHNMSCQENDEDPPVDNVIEEAVEYVNNF